MKENGAWGGQTNLAIVKYIAIFYNLSLWKNLNSRQVQAQIGNWTFVAIL